MTIPKDKLLRTGQLTLAGLAVLLTVSSIAALASRNEGDEEAESLINRYAIMIGVDQADADPNAKDQPTTEAKTPATDQSKKGAKPPAKSPQDEQVDRICKRNLFVPAPPKNSFKSKLAAVLGNQAYFHGNGSGYKVGKDYKGAKIKQIGPDWVEIEFEGKTKKLHVFGPGGGGPSPSPGGPSGGPPGAMRSGRRGRGGDMEITPQMLEMFKRMPAEHRQKALESMPPEMKEKLTKALK